MSSIFDSLKKVSGKTGAGEVNAPEVEKMEINDMKAQILEKLREKREAAPGPVESEKPPISRDEIFKAIKFPGPPARPIERIIIKKDEELARQYEKLKSELELKNAAIRDLEKSLENEKARAADSAEILKTRGDKLVDADKLSRELEDARRLSEEHRARHENLQVEHKKAALSRDETAKLLKVLRAELDVKDKLIHALQKRSEKADELEKVIRAGDRKTAESDKLLRELEAAKKLGEEYRAKFEAAQAEAKRLVSETVGHPGRLKEEQVKRDALVQDLQKKFADELDVAVKERDRVASNVESLRSKLYAATKEIKEYITKITQIEEASRSKDRKIQDLDRSCAEISASKSEIESKLREAESDNKRLSEKQAIFTDELGGDRARIDQMAKSYGELKASYENANLQLQASLRNEKDLGSRIEHLKSELEAKTERLAEADRLYKELDVAVSELTSKIQTNYRQTKELEASNEELALQLSNARRDKKELEARASEFVSESEAKNARLEAAGIAYEEQEAIIKDTTAKLQASLRRVEELEREVSSLGESAKSTPLKMRELEDNAKSEIDKLSAELVSLRNIVKQKEKNELELRSSVEYLETEVQTRDSKIEGDLKYTEKIVKEIAELRKKVAVLERHPERTKSADA